MLFVCNWLCGICATKGLVLGQILWLDIKRTQDLLLQVSGMCLLKSITTEFAAYNFDFFLRLGSHVGQGFHWTSRYIGV